MYSTCTYQGSPFWSKSIFESFQRCGGSGILFAGPSKVFTQANKDQQRESNHAVYSLYNPDILGDSDN